ncbi:LOW QUALITY PROTEIN: T-complex protein 1 subunit zeta-like [Schistocerca gregaria]|uniref:LOW QUALITY PROTEIN: T-complex protein 1 subunit zeta-like n=1 Tax=Schistocerca gregaria TaxID=7010 RepID=UPI00211EC40A|nr:LOW QUALITY PROTEIN: T-complex protein 1 subunit zeta-like [Schistocerca gregaria]
MAAVSVLNENNEVARKFHALLFNISAAKSLQNIVKSNLGPRGTLKMLVSGGGDIKLTKDSGNLLKEVYIQHPTASLIARTVGVQDEITGDGTTSIALLIGELLSQSERLLAEGMHPRLLAEGFEVSKSHLMKWIDEIKVKKDWRDHEFLTSLARTSLRTKLDRELADRLADIVVDAVLTIKRDDEPIDLHMIETNLHMLHRTEMDTQLIKGLVMDHGARHSGMPKRVTNAHILTCNVSFEYEKTEETGIGMWKVPEERDRMIEGERRFTDNRVLKVIELKRSVCKEGEGFVVVNQKGIDPIALDMLAKEGILALRRAKRRNMERLTRACGGLAVNSVDNLSPEVLGFAGLIYEHTLGEEKYTFVEQVSNPFSCTILFKGPNLYGINQIKDAARDGLRNVKSAIEDSYVLPGAGAFEMAAHSELMRLRDSYQSSSTSLGVKLGIEAFAKSLLIIPRTLAANSGFQPVETLLLLENEHQQGHLVGLNTETGDTMDPSVEGIWDSLAVKTHLLESSCLVASQLLLVDEVLKAGKATTT